MSLEKLTQEINRIHNQQKTKMWQEKLATAKADLDRMGKEIEEQNKEIKRLKEYRAFVHQKINKQEAPWPYHVWEQTLKGEK